MRCISSSISKQVIWINRYRGELEQPISFCTWLGDKEKGKCPLSEPTTFPAAVPRPRKRNCLFYCWDIDIHVRLMWPQPRQSKNVKDIRCTILIHLFDNNKNKEKRRVCLCVFTYKLIFKSRFKLRYLIKSQRISQRKRILEVKKYR